MCQVSGLFCQIMILYCVSSRKCGFRQIIWKLPGRHFSCQNLPELKLRMIIDTPTHVERIPINISSLCRPPNSRITGESVTMYPAEKRYRLFPAGTRRNDNVFITSKRRRRRRFDVMKTLSLRHYCVMCPVGWRQSVQARKE